jgi:hypothetical protein
VIHFWVPETPSGIDSWDPDREPTLHASGAGHNLLELYVRLRRLGVPVTLGPQASAEARLLVVYSKSLHESRAALRVALRALQQADGRLALIRSDAPLSWKFPVRPLVEFMPTAALVRRPWQRWLPPLPQRGLLPRGAARRGRIRSVAFKGNPTNVPPVLRSPQWAEELGARGLEWFLDVPSRTDGPDQRWHDFASVDAVLCVRDPDVVWDVRGKPATRLINAWLAGSIPLAERERGYVELGVDEQDVFFIRTPFDGLEVIDRLNADGELLRRVERRIDERAAEFGPEAVLELWREALVQAAISGMPILHRPALAARVYRARAVAAVATPLDPFLRRADRRLAPAKRWGARWKRKLRALRVSSERDPYPPAA